MKRNLTLLLAALMLVFCLAPVQAETQTNYNYAYQCEDLGFTLYVDASWEGLFLSGNAVLSKYSVNKNDAGVLQNGYIELSYLNDPSSVPEDAIESWLAANADPLYVISVARADSTFVPAECEGFSPAWSKTDGNYSYTLYQVNDPAAHPGAEKDAILNGIAEPDNVISTYAPIVYESTFEAEDAATGDTYTDEIFAQADVTMLNIWATFCGPCLNEMPELGELSRDYAGDDTFQIVGVVLDATDSSTADTAREIITATQADYIHLLPSDSLVAAYAADVQAVPTTLFINREGAVLGMVVGSNSKADWQTIIAQYLKA